jgi:hypothetical protein
MKIGTALFATVSLIALAAVSGAAAGTAASTRPRTTEPPAVWDVHVTLTDTRIGLGRKSAPRGDVARFIMRNVGTRPHSFTLGTAARGTGVQTGFSHTLKPKQLKIVFLFLDYRGQLRYFSKVPADRSKPGMQGVFTVT